MGVSRLAVVPSRHGRREGSLGRRALAFRVANGSRGWWDRVGRFGSPTEASVVGRSPWASARTRERERASERKKMTGGAALSVKEREGEWARAGWAAAGPVACGRGRASGPPGWAGRRKQPEFVLFRFCFSFSNK
jgi:hypothetical protein